MPLEVVNCFVSNGALIQQIARIFFNGIYLRNNYGSGFGEIQITENEIVLTRNFDSNIPGLTSSLSLGRNRLYVENKFSNGAAILEALYCLNQSGFRCVNPWAADEKLETVLDDSMGFQMLYNDDPIMELLRPTIASDYLRKSVSGLRIKEPNGNGAHNKVFLGFEDTQPMMRLVSDEHSDLTLQSQNQSYSTSLKLSTHYVNGSALEMQNGLDVTRITDSMLTVNGRSASLQRMVYQSNGAAEVLPQIGEMCIASDMGACTVLRGTNLPTDGSVGTLQRYVGSDNLGDGEGFRIRQSDSDTGWATIPGTYKVIGKCKISNVTNSNIFMLMRFL
jgi:hypothetical protein